MAQELEKPGDEWLSPAPRPGKLDVLLEVPGVSLLQPYVDALLYQGTFYAQAERFVRCDKPGK